MKRKKKGCCGGQNLGWEPEKLHCMHVMTIQNPTVKFSKYEFNNKLLGGVKFFKVTSGVTRTQPYIS